MSDAKIYGYDVEIESLCTHSEHEHEAYGSWEEHYSNRFGRIFPVEQGGDIISSIKAKSGEKVWVVWVEYSTGDSFGNSHCGSTEAIAIFKDIDAAEELVKALENSKRDSDDNFYCETSDGQIIKIDYTPWTGYFETLEEVHLDRVTMDKK